MAMKVGANILVIDDNTDFRVLVKEVLESKGFSVFEAGDGEQALDLMNRTPFNMAIVDLDMPRMNGIEFSKLAKAKNPRFPIIMLTAYAQFYTPAEILSAGVDAFLQKPVDLDRLTKAIERL
jgi:CheY-like chemotaxis protein